MFVDQPYTLRQLFAGIGTHLHHGEMSSVQKMLTPLDQLFNLNLSADYCHCRFINEKIAVNCTVCFFSSSNDLSFIVSTGFFWKHFCLIQIAMCYDDVTKTVI